MEFGNSLDSFIAAADRALRAVFAPAHASRPVPDSPPVDEQARPAASASVNATLDGAMQNTATTRHAASESPPFNSTEPLSPTQQREVAALMRVNHAGEIAAQALYHGQALVARSNVTRDMLLKAAAEETDHLAWCETRLKELDSRPSLLNPLWYAGSFAIGVLAALAGDKTSLGFVVETERQVEGHLDSHLARLPAADQRSRAILQTMRNDEIAHGANARAAGGAELPTPIRMLMQRTARVMTSTAYWL